MKERDKVMFNDLVPSYLTRRLKSETHIIKFIDNKGLVFLEDDPGNPKTKFQQKWLRVVREA
jgi:hypothetical protein